MKQRGRLLAALAAFALLAALGWWLLNSQSASDSHSGNLFDESARRESPPSSHQPSDRRGGKQSARAGGTANQGRETGDLGYLADDQRNRRSEGSSDATTSAAEKAGQIASDLNEAIERYAAQMAERRARYPVVVEQVSRSPRLSTALSPATPGVGPQDADGLALSGDGETAALAWPGGISILSTATGEERLLLRTQNPLSPSLSFDGTRLAFASAMRPGVVLIAELGSGSVAEVPVLIAEDLQRPSIAAHGRVALSPDGKTLATRLHNLNGPLRWISLEASGSWSRPRTWQGCSSSISGFTWTNDGRLFALDTDTRTLYSGVPWETPRELNLLGARVRIGDHLLTSPIGSTVAVSNPQRATLYSTTTGKQSGSTPALKSLDTPVRPFALASSTRVWQPRSWTVELYDVEADVLRKRFETPDPFRLQRTFGHVALSRDGRVLVALELRYGRLWAWNVASGELRFGAGDGEHGDHAHINEIWSISWSPDGTSVVSCDGQTAKLWSSATGDLQRTIEVERSGRSVLGVRSACFDGDGQAIWISAQQSVMRYSLDAEAAPMALALSNDAAQPTMLRRDPEGMAVELGSQGTVIVTPDHRGGWQTQNLGEKVSLHHWVADQESFLISSPGGRYALVPERDDNVRAMSSTYVRDACLSNNGKWLFTCQLDAVQVQRADGSRVPLRFSGGSFGDPRQIESLPGDRIAIGTSGGWLIVLDAAALPEFLEKQETAKPEVLDHLTPAILTSLDAMSAAENSPLLRYWRAHSGPVTAIASSPFGAQLATGGWDHALKIWNP